MEYNHRTDAETVRNFFYYNPETGDFTWRISSSSCRPVGSIAGTVDREGYRIIGVDKRLYRAHRLAWLYVHGEWPLGEIDHINRIKSDNRIENLRVVSGTENQKNARLRKDNKSGFTGVRFHKTRKRWEAYITVDQKMLDLGHFGSDFEGKMMAIAARKNAEEKYGFHPNHGKTLCGTITSASTED